VEPLTERRHNGFLLARGKMTRNSADHSDSCSFNLGSGQNLVRGGIAAMNRKPQRDDPFDVLDVRCDNLLGNSFAPSKITLEDLALASVHPNFAQAID
jgi:hypothetical protein